jgi:hypothetical protein
MPPLGNWGGLGYLKTNSTHVPTHRLSRLVASRTQHSYSGKQAGSTEASHVVSRGCNWRANWALRLLLLVFSAGLKHERNATDGSSSACALWSKQAPHEGTSKRHNKQHVMTQVKRGSAGCLENGDVQEQIVEVRLLQGFQKAQ